MGNLTMERGIVAALFIYTSLSGLVRLNIGIILQCDPLCVDGIRTRKVWCETVPEGVVVPDIRCNCDLRPPTSQVCSDVPGLDTCLLTPIWKTGEFSAVRSFVMMMTLQMKLSWLPFFMITYVDNFSRDCDFCTYIPSVPRDVQVE